MRKKIAFFMYDMRTGGVETVLVNTIDALLAQDVEITLYCHRKIIEPVHIEWLKKHPSVRVVVYYPLARFFDKQNRKHPIIRALKRIFFGIYRWYRNLLMAPRVRRQHFDAIIDYISGYSAKPLRKIKDVLKITWVHCSMNYFRDYNLISGLGQYDKIICISDSFLKEFAHEYPQYATRAVRIYNPINFAQIHEKLKSAKIPSGKYFSCVSRLDADKDIPTLLYAFDKFWTKENKPNVNLYIIGDGAKRDEYVDIAKNLSSSSHIIFVGKTSNPFGYMRGAMAHVLSSFNEGLPTVLIESMATGTVNISSDCPNGPHEILMDGAAGVLFEPGDVDALAKIFGNIYNNKTDTESLIATATKSLSRFDSGNIASQIIDLIDGE
jgi:glycosyltransferase involved in cell wall biosynthesis